MKTSSHKGSGFTLIEIMIVVAIIAILVAMAVPLFMRARENSQKNTCISNLRMMDSAISSWALEARKSIGSPVLTDALFGPTNMIREIPICPSGGKFAFNNVGDTPQVSCSFASLGHVLPGASVP